LSAAISTDLKTPANALDTEQQILEAALIVFSRKGRDGARMQEIADLAGINKALLHYYFRSKNGLYERVFAHVLEKLVESFGTRLSDAQDFSGLLHAVIDGYIDFVAGNLAVMRLMVTEHLAGGERIAERLWMMMQSADSPPRIFVERMSQAAARGEIRHVDPHQTLITIISSCVFFFLIFPTVEAIVPLAKADRLAFIRQRKKHLYDLVSRSLLPDTPDSRTNPERETPTDR